MLRAVTSLGDTALLLPASILVLGYLVWTRQTGAAWAWAAAIAACGAITFMAKLGFRTCGVETGEFDVQSPSGHASVAATFYGSLTFLLATGRPRWQKLGIAAGTLGLVLVIGLSRVRVHAHTPEEVVIGLVIGAACVTIFRALHLWSGPRPTGIMPVILGFAVAVALVGGRHLGFEGVIAAIARRINHVLELCS